MADYRTHKVAKGYRISINFAAIPRTQKLSSEVIEFLVTRAIAENSLIRDTFDMRELEVKKFDDDDQISLGYSYP